MTSPRTQPRTRVFSLAALLGSALLAAPLMSQSPAESPVEAARKLLAAGDRAAARKLLTTAVEKGGEGERAARLLLAEAQVADGDPGDALETLQPLVDAQDYEGVLAAGQAFKSWSELLARSPRKREDAQFYLEQAQAHFEQAAALAPAGDSRAAVEAGFLEIYQLQDWQAAERRADELLKAAPRDGLALLLRGCARVYASVEAAQESEADGATARAQAIADLVDADEVLKTRIEPWAQLIWLYETDGQAQKAVNAAIQILDRTPGGDLSTLYRLARRYAAERRFDAAGNAVVEMARRDAAQLTQLLRAEQLITPAAQDLAWSIGPAIEGLGGVPNPARLAPYIAALKAICAAEPRSADVYNNYALLCRDARLYEDSYRAYEQALALSPEDPRLLNDTALVLHYYLHRDYERAAELYELAVEKADEQLKNKDLTAAAKADLELARKDAAGNLQKLARGEYEWGI
ncbi:MAG: hypothetical protein ACT4PU_12545 [Planctomycetota bacterium]